ncbi:MAG: hypothetical protein KBD21_00660 [Candidatus Pacebacteria bacterium]|nr:hypothetical protein [Candidatus Paceibacterota bacterium]
MEGNNSPLSNKGIEQAVAIGRTLYDMFSVPRENEPTLVRIALSNDIRVRETLQLACVIDGDEILLDGRLITERDAACTHVTAVLDRCVAYQGAIGAGLMLVVGHGEVPAMLAEELHCRLTGEELAITGHTLPGHGYMLRDGKVFKISPEHNPVIHSLA